jgi:hypothetical protein
MIDRGREGIALPLFTAAYRVVVTVVDDANGLPV